MYFRGDSVALLRKFFGKQETASVGKGAEHDPTPAQYKIRAGDTEVSLPFAISKFVDFGGTRSKQQINTMGYIAKFLYHARPEWFPKLSEMQPVPRGLSIKNKVSEVGRIVFEKGINDAVLKAYLRESETIDDLLRYLEGASSRRTLYSRDW